MQCNVINFDSDSVEIVLDNSANTHIWSRLDDFVEGTVVYLSDDTEYGVVTIGDTECRPIAHGTVLVSLMNDDNKECSIELRDTLYFPTSPVNVLGVTKLGEQLNDENGTWIKTRWRRSTFTWDFGENKINFAHSSSKLPVVSVKVGFQSFASFCSLFDRAGAMIEPTALSTCRTTLPTDLSDNICFLTSDNRESQTMPRHRFEQPTTLPSSQHSIGDRVKLTHNGGVHQAVDILRISEDQETSSPKYSVVLRDGSVMEVTKEFLSLLDEVDMAQLPITMEEVENTH